MKGLCLIGSLILVGCTHPTTPTAANPSARQRYWEIQAEQRQPRSHRFVLIQPARLEDGIHRVPTPVPILYP